MAGNEWINGYLEAILNSGGAGVAEEQRPSSAAAAAAVEPAEVGVRGAHFNPTRYFVEEVVTGVDETDIYRTWVKVVATRNVKERSSRLENMCWRIWHLARKKKQIEWEDHQRLAKQRWEREQGRKEATEEMLEELSEGEKGDTVGEMVHNETPKKKPHSNAPDFQLWSEENKEKKLYIVLISLHGLVRGENKELGSDSDTGEFHLTTSNHVDFLEYILKTQVKYVVELAKALSMMPGVYRVDLFTRQIASPDVDWSYGEPTEMLSTGSSDVEGNELALAHIINMSRVLGEQVGGGHPVWPYVIHGHYADAGDSAVLLSGALNVPMVLTGHSLGRNKLDQLLKQGRQSKNDINATYKIMRRIEAEELSLDAAELVITSTKQEIEEQWGLYDGFDVKLERVLRARARRGVSCHGRYMPRMVVSFTIIFVNFTMAEADGDLATIIGLDGASPKSIPPIWSEGVFVNPALVEPFGLTLIEAAAHGLPMVATKNGGPVDIQRALNNGLLVDPHDEKEIADALLKLVAEKSLWVECRRNGWRNIHRFSWPEHCRIYLTRVAACRMRHPQWQTDTPVALDDDDEELFGDSLNDVHESYLRLSIDDKISVNDSGSPGLNDDVDADLPDQVKRILSKIKKQATPESQSGSVKPIEPASGNALNKYPLLRRRRRLFVFALDCYGENGAPEKKTVQVIQQVFRTVRSDSQLSRISGFAISTAMPLSETLNLLKLGKIQMTDFDALICGSGSEIYYPGTVQCTDADGRMHPDKDFAAHIDYRWEYEGVKRTVEKLMNFHDPQEGNKVQAASENVVEDAAASNAHCISFLINDLSKAKPIDELRQKVRLRGLRCHLMYSEAGELNIIAGVAEGVRGIHGITVKTVCCCIRLLGMAGQNEDEKRMRGTL
ncbi:Sucrose-phosphate synthase [Platanthera zijinensis]|uniref:sucrose-phosphate synthase n=1 Tax=Platanthera zijinensis TaxID=2320716 RepID=A0AAP0G569_9ASPA